MRVQGGGGECFADAPVQKLLHRVGLAFPDAMIKIRLPDKIVPIPIVRAFTGT